MPIIVLELALGFAIGLSLGLLGGGGSILTVPALVYLVGQSPQVAVTTSLAIVGANSAVGAVIYQRAGKRGQNAFNLEVALLFGGAGMLVSFLAAGLSKAMSPALIMVLFAVLMLLVGSLMLLQKRPAAEASLPGDPQHHPKKWLTLLAGAVVGLVTGVLGVGGGFLIVPALVLLLGLPMAQAVGTSLAIIAANSFAGLAGHLGEPVDGWVITLFVIAGIGGMLVGSRLARRLPAARLRQLFGLFVIVLAVFLLIDNLSRLVA
jgi:uncharacterized protein